MANPWAGRLLGEIGKIGSERRSLHWRGFPEWIRFCTVRKAMLKLSRNLGEGVRKEIALI